VKPYYQDDAATIYHGDCFDILHRLEGLGAIVTDPPYSSGGMFRGDRMATTVSKYVASDTAAYRPAFAGDNRDQRAFCAWATMWLNASRRACVDGAPLLCFTDWRQLPTMTDAVQAGGWVLLNMATWWKPGIRMQRGRFSSSAEYVLYGGNGPVTDGAKAVQNVFRCAPVGDKQHIAEKPVDVLRWLLHLVPAGSTVLDPFMG
jgi:site-specific DNA-methyltransferase (adenine-specific)